MTPSRIVDRIASDLHRLGIAEGDVILVHSSFKSLGVPGLSPETVIRGFLTALGPDGTLLMPSLSYHQMPHAVHSTRSSPSCVGALPEYFRLREGTRRSVHPTHSVCAVGPATSDLLGRHQDDSTPCGPSSPFRLILELDAKIVMLGCGLRPNTTMHALEELVEPPYLFGGFCEYRITPLSGAQYTKSYRTHGFGGWTQRYDRIELLGCRGLTTAGPVLEADTFVIHTRKLREAVLSRLREDPFFFVERRTLA